MISKFYAEHKAAVWGTGIIVAVISAWLIVAWFSASSEITVPKAERHEANANIAAQQSTVAEVQANAIRDQRLDAHEATTRSRGTLKERKSNYEQVRKTANANGVDGANLDSRERNLQSDLDRLYPANR